MSGKWFDGAPSNYAGMVNVVWRDKDGERKSQRCASFPPFGVSIDGVDGRELGATERTAFGEVTKAVPYSRIVMWQYAE